MYGVINAKLAQKGPEFVHYVPTVINIFEKTVAS